MANYWMKAWNTVLVDTVHWLSYGQPDPTGSESGYPPVQLVGTIVREVIATTGVDPGQGGGTWEYPPMSTEPYAPPPIDSAASDWPDPPNPGFFYENDMVEGIGPAVGTMATMPANFGTGDLTDLMSEYP